jgi:hypothetical protein
VKYRRWTFGASLTVDPALCRCGYDKDDGRHLPVEECEAFVGKCPDEKAHHAFRRRRVPARIKRETTW